MKLSTELKYTFTSYFSDKSMCNKELGEGGGIVVERLTLNL